MYKILVDRTTQNENMIFISTNKENNYINADEILNKLCDGTLKIYKDEFYKITPIGDKGYMTYRGFDYIVK